ADEMDRAEVLSSYTVVPDAAGLAEAYRPLVTDVGADIVSIQVMSPDPMATIEVIGKEVLPQLRALAREDVPRRTGAALPARISALFATVGVPPGGRVVREL